MKKALLIIALIALCAFGWNSAIYKTDGGDKMVVASGGTLEVSGGVVKVGANASSAINVIEIGQVDLADGETSITLTLTGVTAGDSVVATPNEDLGDATYWFAAAGTDSITIYVDQDPGATITFNYAVYGKE